MTSTDAGLDMQDSVLAIVVKLGLMERMHGVFSVYINLRRYESLVLYDKGPHINLSIRSNNSSFASLKNHGMSLIA